MQISLQEAVGKNYADFWNTRKRYRVCKGSRASKKSKTAALNLIYRLLVYPESNALCVRRYSNTLRDSVYSDLKWAVHRLGLDGYFDCTVSPMQIIRRSTGQKILFRGLDDGLKITSISVDRGVLCWVWIEEAYEISSEADFNMLDESIRGELSEESGLFKQITLTFNPWNERHWLKARFFDRPDPDTLALTTNYTCNEWLDAADRRLFEQMRLHNPRRYQVAGLGEWGVVEGLIFENWQEQLFSVDEVRQLPGVRAVFGLDFGYSADPTALFCGLVDVAGKQLWVFDEIYQRGMSNERIAEAVRRAGYAKERIRATNGSPATAGSRTDSAEPKSIDRLRELGLVHIRKARKGRDSVNNGIDFLQDFRILVLPKCVNFLTEIGNYTWARDSQIGRQLNRPIDDFNHLMDAMRYAVEEVAQGAAFSFE